MASKLNLPGMDLMKGMGIGALNIGNVLDTMGFVRKAWGAMNAPSAFMPTMDVEELNKRIVDLQAVEQWLVMNLNMIQGSIQALEVQRATIETLKGVTRGLMPGGFVGAPDAHGVPSLQQLMQMSMQLPQAPAAAPPVVAQAPQPAPAPPPEVAPPPRAAREKSPEKNKPEAIDPGLSATAWLEFLQSQFNQVAQAAMTGAIAKVGKPAGSKASAPEAGKPRASRSRKPAASKARRRPARDAA